MMISLSNSDWGSWGAGLVLASLATIGGAPPADDLTEHEARLEALRDDLDAAERARYEAYDAAETPKEVAAAQAINPWEGLRERCDALAFEAAGTEVAAGAWAMICVNELRWGTREPAWEAFQILVNDHKESEELIPVVAGLRGYAHENPEAVAGLHQLVETSEAAPVRAVSLFTLAKLLENDDLTREKAFELYRRLVADYADLDAGRGSTYGEKATAALFEAEHLRIGQPVPDFTAIDETKTSFRLSDYKGKVVLIDFWGFW